MATAGLLALIDDVTTIADDVATLTIAATKKTTGLVTDDMAVTAEQTAGVASQRELPVVWAVAKGSLFNKGVLLAPGALLLDAVAPWSIGPILMAGGWFLCFEGVEKFLHKVRPHHGEHGADHHGPPAADPTPAQVAAAQAEVAAVDPRAREKKRVRGAIRTDLILSAEIVAITLGEITEAEFWTKVTVLYAVSLIITVGVYGMVALLVRLDDIGAALARKGGGAETVGTAIVRGTPWLLRGITWLGMIAMLLVGGHILVHGIPPLEHAIHDLAHHVPFEGAFTTAADFVVGGVFGAIAVALLATGIPGRVWAAVQGLWPRS